MRRLDALIVEDETIAADRLAAMLAECATPVRVAGRTGSIAESAEWLRNHTADLIFLDIQLSDGLCFSIFEQVAVATPVIFTTAYDQYMVNAFRLNSIDYLLKPVRRDELEAALAKYESMQSAFAPNLGRLLDELQGRGAEWKKRFVITYGDRIKKVEVSEIAWFHAMEKSVFLRTFANQSMPLDHTLDRIEQMVDPAKFFRINRKYIVSIDAIAGMTAWSRSRIKIDLKPPADREDDAVVSIDRAMEFRKWLNA